MTGLLLALCLLRCTASAIKPGYEDCLSREGWRGSCVQSWECLPLGDLVAGGYQPELCGPGGPSVCCPTHLQPQDNLLNFQMPLLPGVGNPFAMTPSYKRAVYPGGRRRYPSAYLKTYIQDEDDNTIVRVTPLRSRVKRKPLIPPFVGVRKAAKLASYGSELVVQDNQELIGLDIAESSALKRCEEYATLAWETLAGLTNAVQEFCPGDYMDPAVLTAELPFMVGLGYEDAEGKIFWGCSGTLISKEYVLTAAHCLHPPLGRPKLAMLGSPHLDSRGDGLQASISEVLLHPLYDPSDRTANIALLRLAPVPHLGLNLRPACLQANTTGGLLTPYWIKDFTVSLKLEGESGQLMESDAFILRKSRAVEVSIRHCNSSAPHICIETVACQSESEGGEPLLQKDVHNPCLHSVVGVAIDKACEPFQPSLYTSIQPYMSWIENIVWN